MTVDLLVIGGSGFVGGRVLRAAQAQGLTSAYTYATHRREWAMPGYAVNLEDENSALEDCLRQTRPAAVIYCAVPAVGAPESLHHQVSVRGVERAVRALSPGARLVYVSSIAVFNSWNGPYRESAPYEERTDRHRAYGLMRARGEQAALNNWPNTVVVRTSHVEGRDADGNLHWRLAEVVDRLKAGQILPRFTDRSISPTWVQTLAEGLLEAAYPGFSYRGTIHIAGSRSLTDYTYTRLLACQVGASEEQVRPDRMFPENGPAAYSLVLDVTFSQTLLKTPLRGIDECLPEVLAA